MKRLIYIVTVAIITSLSSCVELSETPLDFVSPENTYSDIATFESMINGCYKSFGDVYSTNFWMAAGDQAFADNLTFTRYDVPTSDGNVFSLWSNSYELINNLNAIIGNIEKSENGSTDQVNSIVGQAKFLRALTYFYLVRYFGDVPSITQEIKSYSGIYDYLRVDQESIYSSIIVEDLKAAETLISDDNSSQSIMASKYAAKTLLSKVYLTMAGAPLNKSENYSLAAAKAKEVIDSKVYTLSDTFEEIFIPANQNSSKSIIFQIAKLSGQGSSYANSLYGSCSLLEGFTNPGMRVYGNFLESFPESPRKEVTFYMNSQPGVDAFINAQNSDGTYVNEIFYEINKDRKYFIKEGEAFAFTSKYSYIGSGEGLYRSEESDQNQIVFRYAEALLIYAEAQAMADGSVNSDSYSAINSVRERAYGVESPLDESLTSSEFIDAVITEREYEFAFEGKRWFDVVRLELPMLYEIYSSDNSLTPEVRSASSPDRYLMPIPEIERELNRNLTQNEGY